MYVWLVLVLAPGWLEPELLLLELEQVLVSEPELSWSWWLRGPSVELLCSPSRSCRSRRHPCSCVPRPAASTPTSLQLAEQRVWVRRLQRAWGQVGECPSSWAVSVPFLVP